MLNDLVAIPETVGQALRNPLDNPEQTLVAVLVLVVAGLLISAVLTAIASPRRNVDSPHDEAGADENQSSDSD